MLKIIVLIFGITYFGQSYSQIDKDQLALDVSKADTENTEKLKSFIWKRNSVTKVKGEVKLTILTEFSFDENGKLQGKIVDSESNVKRKRGVVRGVAQKAAISNSLDYAEDALNLALNYTFMSKGELIDFFGKATLSKRDNIIIATASDVYEKGDMLSISFDEETKLYTRKKFTSSLNEDKIEGEILYETFSSGINHVSTTVLELPAKNSVIEAKNQDYSQRIY